MKTSDLENFIRRSASQACRRIDFKSAEVVVGFVTGTYFLIVEEKPWITMNVELRPLIYIDRPDYWGIEVIACQTGIGLPPNRTLRGGFGNYAIFRKKRN